MWARWLLLEAPRRSWFKILFVWKGNVFGTESRPLPRVARPLWIVFLAEFHCLSLPHCETITPPHTGRSDGFPIVLFTVCRWSCHDLSLICVPTGRKVYSAYKRHTCWLLQMCGVHVYGTHCGHTLPVSVTVALGSLIEYSFHSANHYIPSDGCFQTPSDGLWWDHPQLFHWLIYPLLQALCKLFFFFFFFFFNFKHIFVAS